MNKIKQLLQKPSGLRENIFPITYIQGVKDFETGEPLIDILDRYNHILIPWQGSKESTRDIIPILLRKKGMWVSYMVSEGYHITEKYVGNNDYITTSAWSNELNWELIPALEDLGKIPYDTVTMEMIAPALREAIINNGNIVNVADDEDLINLNGVLKLKDKLYNPIMASGLAVKILRRNWYIGINVLNQSMINTANTIYKVRYDFDLRGNIVEIPSNCILDFTEGGSISNGTLQGNNTLIWGESRGNYNKTGTFRELSGGGGETPETPVALTDLTDINFTNLTAGQFLKYNGLQWVNDDGIMNTSWASIVGKPSTFAPSAHQHSWSDILNPPEVIGAANLSEMLDVIIDTPTTGQFLRYSDGKWINETVEIGTGGGTTALAGLTDDVLLTSLTSGDILQYNGTKWVNTTLSGGEGGTILTAEQINGLNNLIAWWKLDGLGNLYTNKNLYSTGEVSAYGLGEGGSSGGAGSLIELSDVSLTTLVEGQILQYSGGIWKNMTINFEGGGSSLLSGLSDVNLSTLQSGQALIYNGTSWVNSTISSVSWGNITNKPPSFIPTAHTHSWSDITSGIPPTFTPSAHTHSISDITNLQSALDGKAAASHTHTFASLTSKPTTLSGYGITDGMSVTIFDTHVSSNLHLTQAQKDVLAKLSVVNNNLQVSTNLYATGEITAYM